MCMLLALCKLPRCGCLSSSHFFTHLTLFKVDFVNRINNLYNTRWRNNKHLLLQLSRSGWSFGRAGLGAKATYPA